MNNTTGNTISDILNVAAGNKEFKVGIDYQSLILLVIGLFFAMFLAVLLANKITG